MAGFRVINNADAMKKIMLQNIIDALTASGLFVKGQAIRNLSKNNSIDTGDLINKVDIDVTKNRVHIGSTLKHSIYVEKGTGIYAVDGKGRQTAWVYYYDGKKGEKGFRYTKGQKPQPFLTPAGSISPALILVGC